MTNLIEVARGSYEAIVVDTSPFFHGPMLATLDRTDELLVLCGLDVPTLKNVRLAMQTLELLSFPASRMRYIMNRANTNVGLKTREVETALKVKIAHELPSDGMIPLTINRGNPAVLAEPRCDFSKAIGQLAKQVAPQGRIGVPAPAKPQHHPAIAQAPDVPRPSRDEPYVSNDTGTIAPGMRENDVYSLWGPPAAVRHSGEYTYLYFRNGCEYSCGMLDLVMLQNGQVVDAVLRWEGHRYSGQSSSPRATKPHYTPGGDTLTVRPPTTP